MPGRKRIALGGYVYHVLNRANGRLKIFKKHGDFEAFEKIISQGLERFSMRLCGYCIMSNHWHLLLWPQEDGALSEFMRWIRLLTRSVIMQRMTQLVLATCIRDASRFSGQG